jgi:archaemetzincin
MRVTSRRALLLLPWGFSLASVAHAAEPAPLVVLQPLGPGLSAAQLRAVTEALGAFYAVRLETRPSVELPRSAFYPKRSRYRAERLLDFLVERGSPEARVTLGLTAVDISTTKAPYEDWGILGLATLDGRSAVLSSFRCRRGARDQAHAHERLAKTAVHELGHSFGLEHCPTPGCIMHDGEGSVRTTDTEHDLCANTRHRLNATGLLRPNAHSPFLHT